MKIPDDPPDERMLSRLGEEACQLLVTGDFQGLADKFGYALAYDREIATAIKADFEYCLASRGQPQERQNSKLESTVIKRFKPNSVGLLVLIECVILIDESTRVLVELVVAKNSQGANLYLEDISTMT